MGRFLSFKKETIGISPDSMIFVGEVKCENTRLTTIEYNANVLFEKELNVISDFIKKQDPETNTWLNIDGLHDMELIKAIGEHFNLAPFIISDIVDTHKRPSIVEHENCLYLSIKMLQFNDQEKQISSENLGILINKHELISFQEKVGNVFEPIRIRLRRNKKHIRNSGVDFLAYSIIDIIIDSYINILSELGESIEMIDDELLSSPNKKVLSEIYKYKSEINYMRKIIKPCREMIFAFVKMDSDYIGEDIHVHIKKLENNINHANDAVNNYHALLSEQLNMFHSIMSNRLNEILKVLTIFSVIFIPLTFIAGIYGTNFDYIPELHFKYSYFVMWGLLILIAFVMIVIFKRKKWL